MNPVTYYQALAAIPGLGPKTLKTLVATFGNAAAVLAATEEALCQVPRVTAAVAAAIREAATTLEQWTEQRLALEEVGVWLRCWEDEDYPLLLRALPDAPPLLYGRGTLRVEDRDAVAIIGSREASDRGLELATRLAGGLAERGLTVVSGFARGIDTAAHRGALEAGGRTLAVFGTGIDRIHPRENHELAGRIVRQGALLTEFPPGTSPSVGTLMARDRIVSGLSRAVIVVEAGTRSGSLDTATRARQQNRRLYAVDWAGTEVASDGTAQLLREGALALPALPSAVDFGRLAGEILETEIGSQEPDSANISPQLSLF